MGEQAGRVGLGYLLKAFLAGLSSLGCEGWVHWFWGCCQAARTLPVMSLISLYIIFVCFRSESPHGLYPQGQGSHSSCSL